MLCWQRPEPLYGRRLRAEDYRRLTDCHTMTELANELKALPLYANTLAEVNPTYARRAQLENLLRAKPVRTLRQPVPV